jgi:DNA repair exonuclease SbcCD ATPase subunit
MLKKLTTKNFRKLTDNVFEFGEGLQVVRGQNENGKSTMLEAIGYALSGIKACRDTLEEVVTWGQPVRALKVELVMEFDGVEYTITRSKAGAEINYEGGKVVGQTECTAFIERLLGVDSGTIARLMMAPQGAIRGALDEKGGKAMALIEQLANFDIIDTVIDLITSHLVTGPTQSAEDRVARAEVAVTEAKAAVQPVDTAAIEQQLEGWKVETYELTSVVENISRPHVERAKKDLDEAAAVVQKLRTILQQMRTVEEANHRLSVQYNQAAEAARRGPKPEDIEKLERAVMDARTAAARATAWKAVQNLMSQYPESYWEGDADQLQGAIDVVRERFHMQDGLSKSMDAEERTLRSQMHTAGTTCKACGQALPDAAAVQKHNTEIHVKIMDLVKQQAVIANARLEADQELQDLLRVQKAARPYDQLAAELRPTGYVEVLDQFVPPQIKWIGDEPVAVDVAALQRELDRLRQQHQAQQVAKGRVAALAEQIEDGKLQFMKLHSQAAELRTAEDWHETMQIIFERANAEYQAKEGRLQELRYYIEKARGELALAKQQHEQQLLAVKKAEEEQQRALNDLKALEFNNALLKRVRAARPIIADKLWTIVLSAVSSYFSAMRGVKSVVTRAGNEFRVDGKPISGLSGSTLDLLGLSIRLALTRTFLPNTPFLILDEPAAAMDSERTESMLGFLVGTGFQQTLLVTHDEMSETVAQKLITI